MKNKTTKHRLWGSFCTLFLFFVSNVLIAQVDGDFRSRGNGLWQGTSTWQIRSSGSWANTTSAPTSSSNVYIQTGHLIQVNAASNAVCKDLHLCVSGSTARINFAASATPGDSFVTIHGKLRAFTHASASTGSTDGNIPGTSSTSGRTTVVSSVNTMSAFFNFVGSSRTILESGEWGFAAIGTGTITTTTRGFTVQCTPDDDATFTVKAPFVCRNFSLYAGSMVFSDAAEVSVNSGNNLGSVNFFNGVTVTVEKTGRVFGRYGTSSPTAPASTLNIDGTFILTGAAPSVYFGSIVFSENSTVIMGAAGAQTLLASTGETGGSNPENYFNLTVRNSGTKTAANNITISGTLSLEGTASIAQSTYTIAYNQDFGLYSPSLVYNRTVATSASSEGHWPTTNGPLNVSILQNTVTLDADRTIPSAGILNIEDGSRLILGSSIPNNDALTINGTLTGTGTITGNRSSTINVGGTGDLGTLYMTQTSNYPSGTTNILNNLYINRSGGAVDLGNSLVIAGIAGAGGSLDVEGGSTLNTAGFLRVASEDSGFPNHVKDLSNNSGGTITGDVVVERSFPSARKWRMLSSPVFNEATTYLLQWGIGQRTVPGLVTSDNGAEATSAKNQPTGYGTLIRGHNYTDVSSANAAGYDYWPEISFRASTFRRFVGTATGGSFPARAVDNSYLSTKSIPNTANEVYLLYIRGDRTVTNLSNAGPTVGPTILEPKGTLKQGSYNFSVSPSATQMFAPFGNPYASPVSFSDIYANTGNSTAIKNQFWIWDAKSSGSAGEGQFFLVVNSGGIWVRSPDIEATNAEVIYSGQGVLLEATATGGTFTVNEEDKVTVADQVNPFGAVSNEGGLKGFMQVTLQKQNTELTNAPMETIDGAMLSFRPNFSSLLKDGEDVQKLMPFEGKYGLGILQQGKIVTLDGRPDQFISDTIQLTSEVFTAGKFSFKLKLTEMAGIITNATLVDKFTGTATKIDINGISEVQFSCTSDKSSVDGNRFMIVLDGAPVELLTTTSAQKSGAVVNVDWMVNDNARMCRFEIEKSSDGKEFTFAKDYQSSKVDGAASYNWLDEQPFNGTNYYRVKATTGAGFSQYSKVMKVNMNSGVAGLSVYPNPVKGNSVSIQLTDVAKGSYQVNFVNGVGQRMGNQTIQHNGENNVYQVRVPVTVKNGMYEVLLVGNNKQLRTERVVVQSNQ